MFQSLFCGNAFQISGLSIVMPLSPKEADLRAFTKISLGLTLAFALTESIFLIKFRFNAYTVLKTSAAIFLSLMISVDNFPLRFNSD